MNFKNINSQNIIAISALAIGVCTACIYIYQARIMAKQHQDSVWPYVFVGSSLDKDTGLQIKLYSKGIGPALIHSVRIRSNGKEFESWGAMLKSWEMDSVRFSCSGAGVLSPTEEQMIFAIYDFEQAKQVWQKMREVDVEIIYCSIHDECWKASAKEREKTNTSKKVRTVRCG